MADLFDAEAARYDRAYDGEGPEARRLRERMAVALGLLGPGVGRLLDAGTGPGRLCTEASWRGWQVVGADVSEQMVRLAQARLDGAGHVVQASVDALPFGPASFDAVVLTGVAGYVPDPGALVDDVRSVLRPEGRLVMSIANPSSLHARWRRRVWYVAARFAKRWLRGRRPPPLRRATPIGVEDLRQLLAARDMVVHAVVYTACALVPPPFDLLFPGPSSRLEARLGRLRWTGQRWLAGQIVVAASAPGASTAVPACGDGCRLPE